MFADDVDLRKILLHHERSLIAQLGGRELFGHPTARGDAGEGPWQRLLDKFLPCRYQVSKAFVLDSNGHRSEQIDLVVHDRHFCPLLFDEDGQRFIPAESVFAVFEVKPTLDRGVVESAAKKAESVRVLHRTNRPLVDRGRVRDPRDPFEIIAGVLAVGSSWSPPFGEPLVEVLGEADADARLQLGCAPEAGAFEAFYEEERPRLEVSEGQGSLMFFLLRLFHSLQVIGSPMGIDLRAYSRPLEDTEAGGADTAGEAA
jgi:hypothetical protein